MTAAGRLVAGFLVLTAAVVAPALAPSGVPSAAPSAYADSKAATQDLRVSLTGVGDVADSESVTIRPGQRVVIHGTVSNPGTTAWQDAQAYLQITTDPARTLAGLQTLARTPEGQGSVHLVDTLGLFDQMGDVPARSRVPFTLKVPYAELGISGQPGVYRVAVKVVATSGDGRDPDDAPYASTLMSLLPARSDRVEPAQTVTLLPISAPVKRLAKGTFTDDSLSFLVSPTGRLTNDLDWVLQAPPGTIQVVIDPALLAAIKDMSDGYLVEPADPTKSNLPGEGRIDATLWLQKLALVADQQNIMFLPWGVPSAGSLLAHDLPGPVRSAITASQGYRQGPNRHEFVAGWFTDGNSDIRTVSVVHAVGADLQIVSQDSLPRLATYTRAGDYIPSTVTVSPGGREVPLLVAGTRLAGLATTTATSPIQLRQRMIADATVRSMQRRTDVITVAALPFRWNPGQVKDADGLTPAFDLPVLAAQSAVGALDRPSTPYHGAVHNRPSQSRPLSPALIDRIRQLRRSGGTLTAVLSSPSATIRFQRVFAMSGSAQWHGFPLIGVRLVTAQVTDNQVALSKIRITGPPLVAMSSDSGRFPLTVTNGLGRPVTVSILVRPADPAVSVEPIKPFQVAPGERSDVPVVTTASGSGVTSVGARLTTPNGNGFGRPWRFDVRSTQIGLVIWIVLGVGGVVLFGAAGYRIVNRIRGRHGPQQAPN